MRRLIDTKECAAAAAYVRDVGVERGCCEKSDTDVVVIDIYIHIMIVSILQFD